MNSTKVLFALALIAFCCVTFGQSLKCLVCDNKESCKKPNKYDCNQLLANSTRAYLDIYHTGVSLNTTSPYYECFREKLKFSGSDLVYYGCTYENIKGCNLGLRSFVTSGKYERSCKQCHNKDGCNPAGRVNVDVMTIFATIVVALILRYVWH